jgi:hypothetical protein
LEGGEGEVVDVELAPREVGVGEGGVAEGGGAPGGLLAQEVEAAGGHLLGRRIGKGRQGQLPQARQQPERALQKLRPQVHERLLEALPSLRLHTHTRHDTTHTTHERGKGGATGEGERWELCTWPWDPPTPEAWRAVRAW